MIRWFARNPVAANLLMVAILLAGIHSAFFRVTLEVEPSWKRNVIEVNIPYRGATAKDVERAILLPIEAALEGVDGIDMLNADGNRGSARIWVEARNGYDLRTLLEDVQSRIDAISTFPNEIERPTFRIPDRSHERQVLKVAVTGNLSPRELLKVGRRVRDDLLEIEGISLVDLEGDRTFEIAVEADTGRLEAYNLGFGDLADAIRRSSIDLPAGAIRSTSGTLVVRTRGQAYNRDEFAKIPVRASNGSEVLLGEVADIKDGFEERDLVLEFNGKPSLWVKVLRVGDESALEIAKKVKKYVKNAPSRFPEGIHLYITEDESIRIRGRLGTLTWSLLQGCGLVLLMLGLFLRPKLAFWVLMGIPVSFAGAVFLMPGLGVTANITSLFGFLIALGLVVDDAIITGENIYSKFKAGMDPFEASVKGTQEVAIPVTFGALTTIVAFLPLLFFEGDWGQFAKQVPPVVALVLLFSLVESKLVLPSHLTSLKKEISRPGLFSRFQQSIANSLGWFVTRVYQPSLEFAVSNRTSVVSGFIAVALIMAGYCLGGRMGFVSIPSVEKPGVMAYLDLPNNSTIDDTLYHVDRIVAATEQLKKEFMNPGTEDSLIVNVIKIAGWGGHHGGLDASRGLVKIELMPQSHRSKPGPKNSVIVERWLELVGPIPEANYFVIRGEKIGGKRKDREQEPLELELRGVSSEKKNEIARQISDYLKSFDGIATSWARVNNGQDELEFTLKPRATELGLNQVSLARQVRQAFYGEEAQRIQRETDEIRVMVRLPKKSRESLHTLERLRIRTPGGVEVPLTTVANIAFIKAPSHVERNDRAEVIRIGAQPKDEAVDIIGIAKEATPRLLEIINEAENLSFQFTGYVAESEETKRKTILGFIALLLAIYALLAIPFKSLIQPIFVLISVPFGLVGALLGHIVMDITPSHLSVFGMLALTGVVVNDSLVLVDYINRKCREGVPLSKAVLLGGTRRFRPIILTSATTFLGLLPLLLDRSMQAQFLIPMAVSLGAGILISTAITLYLIPCVLVLADDFGKILARMRDWYLRPFLDGAKDNH